MAPTKECDLVMRGGITSGIVYPKAIIELAKEYRFRQIGGASAGAIAAALAAAAEYNRGNSGFDRLKEVPNQLDKGLLPLFQPYPHYRKLFLAVVKQIEKGEAPSVWFWIRNYFRLKSALKTLPVNHYGLCPGTTVPSKKGSDLGLTHWLNQQLEFVSGRIERLDDRPPDVPLTFGELATRGVHLKLITTNLSQNRPFDLPLGNKFKIHLADLSWLLPANVARWIESQHNESADDQVDGFVDVPLDHNMPVILAVRMSLSYPVLFSAVPLYCKDRSLSVDTPACKKTADTLQLNLFSDGGLSSNFPIHYFDAMLPCRPTLGINLTDFHPCRHGDDTADSSWNRIYMPFRAGGGQTYSVNPIEGLGAFIGSLLTSAKDWQDSMQTRLPGYRERLVHVSLKDSEGGLNLSMEPKTIEHLAALGELAAKRILDGEPQSTGMPAPPFSFKVHRWRRLLAADIALAEALSDIAAAYTERNPSGDASLGSIQDYLMELERTYLPNSKVFDELGYDPMTPTEIANLRNRWDALVELHELWTQSPRGSAWNKPDPVASAKLRPQRF
jgi:predicted acylesterase/phospholipase RssA